MFLNQQEVRPRVFCLPKCLPASLPSCLPACIPAGILQRVPTVPAVRDAQLRNRPEQVCTILYNILVMYHLRDKTEQGCYQNTSLTCKGICCFHLISAKNPPECQFTAENM